MNEPVSCSGATGAGTRKRSLPAASAEVRKAGGLVFCGVQGGWYSSQNRLPLSSVAPRKSTSESVTLRVQRIWGADGHERTSSCPSVPPSNGVPASIRPPASGAGPASWVGPASALGPVFAAGPASGATTTTLLLPQANASAS